MQKGIRNAIINGRGHLVFGTNNPHTESDQEQYYIGETKEFFLQNLQWAHNMVLAEVQGIDYKNFYDYTECRIRTAKVIDPTTGQNLGDDWQRIIIEDANIDFIPRGAKVHFNGNTWLATNPDNIASATGTSIIKRCNATWCHLDWYGNVLKEPFCYGQGGNDLATANNIKINMILLDAYQHCFMQLNPETREIAHNLRILLGDQAYAVRGLQNFVQEFSDEMDSNHIQFFDVTRMETLHELDDVINHVAEGKSFKWEILITGVPEIQVGQEYRFNAVSFRNDVRLAEDQIIYTVLAVDPETGDLTWEIVLPYVGTLLALDEDGKLSRSAGGAKLYIDQHQQLIAEENVVPRPVTYKWVSSDESVATVDQTGTVTAIAPGQAVITCILEQNPSKQSSYAVNVVESGVGTTLAWIAAPPAKLVQYQPMTFEAALLIDGIVQDDQVTYTFSGADERDYEATVQGNKVTVTVYTIPYKPLHVTATCGGYVLETDLRLTGW